MGYAGGSTSAPTYHSLGDHAEAIEIDFDPAVLSYDDLVAQFFASHNACRSAWSTQYRSAVFPRTPAQRASAEAAARRVAEAEGESVETAIEDFTGFSLAEDYHQKYRLRSVRAALAEFEAMFPTTEAFLASVAVTRANAFAAGYGTTLQRRDEMSQLGLSERAQGALRVAAR